MARVIILRARTSIAISIIALALCTCRSEPEPAISGPAAAVSGAQQNEDHSETDESRVEVSHWSFGQLAVQASARGWIRLRSRVAPIVDGVVDSGEPACFILDTGSSTMLISPAEAERWNLPVREVPEFTELGPVGSARNHRCAHCSRLDLAGAIVSDVDASLREGTDSFLPNCLGVSAFGQCPLLFDARNGMARFLDGDSVEKALHERYPGRTWSRLPLHWKTTLPSVELQAGSKQLQMVVDTGSTATDFELNAIKGFELLSVREESIVSEDTSGQHIEKLPVFRFDGLRLGNWICHFEIAPQSDAVIAAVKADGYLGFDLLGQVPFVFDAPGESLWLIDPAPGDDGVLQSSQDSRAIAFFEDPFSECRQFAATATLKAHRRHLLSHVAGLLDDDVADVRAAAAATISGFAHETWPDSTRIEDAKNWWKLHGSESKYLSDTDDDR